MVETDEVFRTSDMALATVLVMSGFRSILEKISAHEAVWVFPDPSDEEEFDRLLERYESRSVRVEPRAFVIEFTKQRQELFAFVPPDPRRRRSSRRPDTSTVE